MKSFVSFLFTCVYAISAHAASVDPFQFLPQTGIADDAIRAVADRPDVRALRDACAIDGIDIDESSAKITEDGNGILLPAMYAIDGRRAYIYYHHDIANDAPPLWLVTVSAVDEQQRPYVEFQIPGTVMRFTPNGSTFDVTEVGGVDENLNLATRLALRVGADDWTFDTIKQCFLQYLGISNISQLSGIITAICRLNSISKDVLAIAEHGSSCVTGGVLSCAYFAGRITQFLTCGAASVITCMNNATQPADQQLNNGQTLSNQSVARGQWRYYSINVPSGRSQLRVTISGSGDADLYVRRASKPTASAYSCRPYLSTSSEVCTFSNPASGQWWIGVNGYTAATFSVKAQY